jgi:shikimate dehydrogenase
VLVANRDAGRAQRLVADLRAGRAVGAQGASELRGVDLLINSTSVGMSGGPDPTGTPLLGAAELQRLPPGARVVDLVYRPALTPLLLAAGRRGLTVQNGLPMLVWQGALAFQQWTGLLAPVPVMRLAAERGLADGVD